MNDEQMHDLKNFLSTEISRQIRSDLREVIHDEVSVQLSGQSKGIMREFAELKTDVAELKTDVKFLKGHAAETDEKLDAIMQAVGEGFEDHRQQIADHDVRITKLETAAA